MPNWTARAAEYLEQALGEIADDIDAIPTVDAAMACLRIDCGEMEPDDELLTHEPTRAMCICPPELTERGGFTSVCPSH